MKSSPPRALFTLLIALCLPWAPASQVAAPQAQASSSQTADAYFAKQDWPNAERAYAALVAAEPGNGKAWFRLGLSRQSQGEFKGAVEAYLKAESIGHNPVVMFNLATAYARLGNRKEALEWLEKAAGAGFSQVDQAKNDPDLASLSGDPRFKAALARLIFSNRNDGPPDLDELWRNFNRKLSELFGRRRGGGARRHCALSSRDDCFDHDGGRRRRQVDGRAGAA